MFTAHIRSLVGMSELASAIGLAAFGASLCTGNPNSRGCCRGVSPGASVGA